MAAEVPKLGSTNKRECFERYAPIEEDIQKAEELFAKTSDFDQFDQAKCQEYMKAHGKTLLALHNTSSVNQVGKKIDAFERVLAEQGLLGGEKDRIPCVLADEVTKTQSVPHTVVRLIRANSDNVWQLLAKMEDETILLGTDHGRWFVEMHWSAKGMRTAYSWHRLFFAPERFLRFSKKLEEHFKIEEAALSVLNQVLPNGPKNIVIHYAGYPTETEKESAEETRNKLKKQAEGSGMMPFFLAPPNVLDPPEPPGIFACLTKWAGNLLK